METIIRKEKRDIRACQAFTANTDCFFTIHESLNIRREERCPTSFPWYCFVFHKTVVERVPPTKRPDLNRKMAPGMFRKNTHPVMFWLPGAGKRKTEDCGYFWSGRLWAKNAIFQKMSKRELINQWHKTAKTHAANWNFLGAMNEQKKVIFFATLPRFLLSLRVNICYHLVGWREPIGNLQRTKKP